MSETVTYRTMRRDDYDAIIEMLCKAWYVDGDCDWNTSMTIAKADFEYCLARTTEARVAVVDEQVVGVILGAIDAHETRGNINKHHVSAHQSLTSLMFNKAGRRKAKQLKNMHRYNREMLEQAKQAGHAYDAEIVLFLVKPKMRGQGIGKALFDWLLDDFKQAGVKHYFLMTDSTCDTAFYGKRGMRQRNEHLPYPESNLEIHDVEEHLRYLMYDNEDDPANEGVNPLGRD